MKKKRVVLLAAALAVAAGTAFGVKALFFSAETQTALTQTTTYGSLSTTIEGTGTTMPADSVTVTTASMAKIEAVYVSAGDTVAAGDLLYVQDDSELDDQIEEYQDEIADLEDELESSYEQLDDLNETMAGLTVSAPFSGRITEVSVEEGDTVAKGAKLALLVDDSRMTLTQYFSYAYEDQISLGMEASLSIPALMRSFDGTVTDIQKVDRVTTEGTRCFAVTVTVDNPGALGEGMTGGGCLITASGEQIYPAVEGVLAPISALKNTSAGTCLFVKADARPDNAMDLEDGTVPDGFYAVPVEVGVSNSQYVRILSGVEQDVEVFTRYQQAAPSGGGTTSQGQNSEEEFSFPGGQGGQMPNFSGGGGGGMPGGMGGGPMG